MIYFQNSLLLAVEKNWVWKWKNRETVDKRQIARKEYTRRNKHGTEVVSCLTYVAIHLVIQ